LIIAATAAAAIAAAPLAVTLRVHAVHDGNRIFPPW
jgi:hypothetical protein